MPEDPPRPTEPVRAFRPATPVVIGILGGVAAGKSAVAAMFAARGLRHVDADQHARAVAAEPPVLAELAAAFGPGLVAGGSLDRTAMARLVFRDPTARTRLEAILHPRIRARILAELAAARAAGQSVLLDAPLLVEGGLIDLCDHAVFVDADPDVRQKRALARGWPPGELERREAAQAPLAMKKARATHTIHNHAGLAETERQVADWLDQLAESPEP